MVESESNEKYILLREFAIHCYMCQFPATVWIATYRDFQTPLPPVCPNCGQNTLHMIQRTGSERKYTHDDLSMIEAFVKISSYLMDKYRGYYPKEK